MYIQRLACNVMYTIRGSNIDKSRYLPCEQVRDSTTSDRDYCREERPKMLLFSPQTQRVEHVGQGLTKNCFCRSRRIRGCCPFHDSYVKYTVNSVSFMYRRKREKEARSLVFIKVFSSWYDLIYRAMCRRARFSAWRCRRRAFVVATSSIRARL